MMTQLIWRAILLVTLVALVSDEATHAQMVRAPYSHQELCARAERVVLGTVESVTPYHFKRAEHYPTETAFEVVIKVAPRGVIKGPTSTHVMYLEPKPGAVQVGEELLVFLNSPSNGMVITTGLEEGRFNIRVDQRGQKWAMNWTNGLIKLEVLLEAAKGK